MVQPFLIMLQNYGGGSIGKLLLLSFKDDDEEILNELFNFLTSKYHMEMINVLPGKTYLEYDDLIIDAKLRAVRSRGEYVELTNMERALLWGRGQRDEFNPENTQEDKARAIKTGLYFDGMGNRI